jgi:Ca2+:H+ antiporter
MNYLYLLFIFIPISIVIKIMHLSDIFLFASACLSIIPLAALMGRATENLAGHAGPRVGGFLNATFGNATELIIAIFALKEGLADVVKASLAGSIIGNILLVLGLSMFAGGMKYKVQNFNVKASGNSSSLLLFAMIGFAIPAIFLHNVELGIIMEYEGLSIFIASLMLIIYIAALIFTFFTHKDVLGAEHSAATEIEWGVGKSVLILILTTIGIAVESEFLVTTIEGVTKSFGWNQMFIGVIILAIIGNAAEHSTAVVMAIKNKMDISVEIATGSSLQIALFVAPMCVFISLILGKPMSLLFNDYELAAIGASVLISNIVSQDGQSNWLEGLQLIIIYLIIACSFYFLPAS